MITLYALLVVIMGAAGQVDRIAVTEGLSWGECRNAAQAETEAAREGRQGRTYVACIPMPAPRFRPETP